MSKAGGYEDYEFIAEYYDHVLPYRHRSDIGFYEEAARQSGGPVLELGCGTGRVLLPIARSGIPIVGIDLSKHMLQFCRMRLKEEPKEVRARAKVVEADMRDFGLDQSFALVTTPFRPFQHLITIEDQISCLRCVNRHLVDGGHFILDIFNPSLEALTRNDLGEEVSPEPEFEMPDGRKVIRRHKIVERDLFNQINHVELIYYVTHPGGREERLVHAFPMRYLFRFEAQHLLERCGFEVEHVYADFEKRSFGSIYPGDLIIVARKICDI